NGVFPKQYKRLDVPGWIRSLNDKNTNIVYDDIYLAYGKGAAARVEIGDAATYSKSKMLEVLSPKTWGSSKIEAKAVSSLEARSKYYVYFTDKEGNTNQEGIPLAAGIAPPVAPVLLLK